MGHIRLGRLPKTTRWKNVIGLLNEGAELEDLASASFHAAWNGLKQVSEDPGFASVLSELFSFVESARSNDFIRGLRESGFDVTRESDFLELVNGLREKTDARLSQQQIKSDAAEIAQNAIAECLVSLCQSSTSSLFETRAAEVQNELGKGLSGKGFKVFMHEFYSRFTRRYLSYYLSRELPLHVGKNCYLGNINEHTEFNNAFDLYVRQTVRITDEFTPGWLGKAIYEGTLTPESISKYAFVAFKKIASEFKRGVEPDG